MEMSLATKIGGIGLAAIFIAMILFVLFGEMTVRKLRKNPATKDVLGIEFASGWNIGNVAFAFAMPRWMNRKLRNSPLAALHADADLLERYTNRFDRILGRAFFWLLVLAVSSIFIAALMGATGISD